MAKPRKHYACTNCGHTQRTWAGICPSCGEAATLEEVVPRAERAGRQAPTSEAPAAAFRSLAEVGEISHERISTGIDELDRVLGGGLVPGAYLVVAGEPGAGKTTLASELCLHLSAAGKSVAYVSGEESQEQARMRFGRLGFKPDVHELLISSELSVERICAAVTGSGYDLIVVDSIQTVFSEDVAGAPGTISQVRECGMKLMRAAKETGTAVLLVGQVTKGGEMAGPRVLEHMVDVVLAFEGDRREQFRILRSVKNRFGATDEIGVFEMTSSGLQGIADPSALFLDPHSNPMVGSVTTSLIEGSRPVMCEIQALVSPSNAPNPIRAVRGLDAKRVQMLLAVLQQKCRVRLGSMDVYINVSGGLKVDDPGADLAVCLAVMSAAEDRPPMKRYCAFGEVSLLGLVRPAPQAERRRKEAERLSYDVLEGDERPLDELLRDCLGAPAAIELQAA